MHPNYVYHGAAPVQGAFQYGSPNALAQPFFIHHPMGLFAPLPQSFPPPPPKPAAGVPKPKPPKVIQNNSKDNSVASAEPNPETSQAFVADKYKTTLCRSYEKGKPCLLGANCMFAHGALDKRTVEMNISDGILTAEDVVEFKRKGIVSPATFENPILAERFKTHFCRSFERKEVCPYGHRCIFAHTQEEKRTLDMNLKDRLFTLEAIEAFRREQPVATAVPSVRVGNGPVVKLAVSVEQPVAQFVEVTLPDPRSFSNSLLVAKKVRGRKKSRKCSQADNSTSSNPANPVVFSDPHSSSLSSQPQLGCSFNSFQPPARPRSTSSNGQTWEDTSSSEDAALLDTVQALMELANEEI